ncbi:GNAT family N-acetyltransferase [Nanoarchaeota archaeon]
MLELKSKYFKSGSDIDYIIEQGFQAFKDPHGFDSLEKYKDFLESFAQNLLVGMVMAYDDEVPVGFALFSPIPKHEHERYLTASLMYPDIDLKIKSMVIEMIVVEEKHRRKGYGEDLVNQVIKELKKENVGHIYATCWNGNNKESYNLFQKCGFRKLMDVPGMYADKSGGIVVFKELF